MLPHGKPGNICLPWAPGPFSPQGKHFMNSFLQGSLKVGHRCTQVFPESTSETVLNGKEPYFVFLQGSGEVGALCIASVHSYNSNNHYLASHLREPLINWSLPQKLASAIIVCAAEAPLPMPATARELCLTVQARKERGRTSRKHSGLNPEY